MVISRYINDKVIPLLKSSIASTLVFYPFEISLSMSKSFESVIPKYDKTLELTKHPVNHYYYYHYLTNKCIFFMHVSNNNLK